MPRTILTPPHGIGNVPDVPNFSWAEYGLRCGLPRMIDAIAGRGLPASASLNASVIDAYPAAADALLQAGWEFIGHGIHQRALSQDGGVGQAEAIAAALDRIERFSGARPRGWLSPGLRETSETPDLLAQAGVDYVFDWCLDDLPNWMRAAPRPLLALPYALELNDSVIHAVEKHATGEFGRRLDHTLNVYAREAAASGMPRVLTLGLHPHLMGVPHRYPDFEAMLDRLQRHSMTRFVTGAELYAWYADQCSPPLRGAGRPGMSGAQTTAARDAEPSQPAASAIDALVAHLQRLRYEDLPAEAVAAARTFLLDAIGVGLSARATRAWRRSSKPPPRWARAPRPRSGPAANGCRWPARSCSTPTRSSTRNSTRSMTAPWCTPSPASRPPRWAMPSARAAWTAGA